MNSGNGQSPTGVSIALRHEAQALVDAKISEAAADHVTAWEADQRVAAVHEAGHAVVASKLGLMVETVDIRNWSGGATYVPMEHDSLPRHTPDSVQLKHLAVAFGGMEAEQLLLGDKTLGSARDLEHATRMAYDRLYAGLDETAPLFHLNAVHPTPNWVVDEYSRAAATILKTQRAVAEEIIKASEKDILRVATAVYRARYLAGQQLWEVLQVEPKA